MIEVLGNSSMATHSHNFVETYKGMVGIGADRDTDEKTIIFYLQKFEHLIFNYYFF